MATYIITGPDGKKYKVTGQGSKEDALKQVQQQVEGSGAPAAAPASHANDPGMSTMDKLMYQVFPDAMVDYMASSGKKTQEAVMNPLQTAQDLPRSMADFASLGAIDPWRAKLKGTNVEDERAATRAADERLGGIDDAFNMGTAMLQPSTGEKYVVQGGQQALKKLAAYGAEGAALSGIEASNKGEDMSDAMISGGIAGAGGSALSDLLTGAGNKISKWWQGEKYPDDASFFADADKAKRNTVEGKSLSNRKARLEAARLAQPEGQSGFRKIQEGQNKLNQKALGIGREEREALANLAHQKNLKAQILGGMGKVLTGGGGIGLFPATKLLSPLGPIAGTALNVASELPGDIRNKNYKAYTSAIRNSGEPRPDPLFSQEDADAYRNILARLSMGAQRNQ